MMKISVEARDFQLVTLVSLFVAGVFLSGFEPQTIVVTMMGALLGEFLGATFDAKRGRYKSAAITATSLALLLRSASLWGLFAAALVAVLSKSLVKWRGAHIFNPANFAIVCMLLLFSEHFWVSPGQWGRPAVLSAAILVAGVLVVSAARQVPVAVMFLLSYGGLFLMRALYLGDPLVLVGHHLTNGSLLIFTFFMVTDPRTAPEALMPRLVYCFATALLAFVLETQFYLRTGLFFALVSSCLLGTMARELFEHRFSFLELRWSRVP